MGLEIETADRHKIGTVNCGKKDKRRFFDKFCKQVSWHMNIAGDMHQFQCGKNVLIKNKSRGYIHKELKMMRIELGKITKIGKIIPRLGTAIDKAEQK